MKKASGILAGLIFVLGTIIWNSGCAKKVVPPVTKAVEPAPAKATPPPPAPTISLLAQPSTITKGQSTVLSWKSSHAAAVEVDGGIGNVAASGAITLTPSDSVTYTAKATGAGGSAAASTRITVEIPIVPQPSRQTFSDSEFFEKRVHDLFFDYDQHQIRTDQMQILDNNVRALKERPELRFTIEGHCDERGSEKYNLALGDRRANSVKSYLVSRGIASDRIDTTTFGKERPFAQGHSEEAWSQNRRGHFVLQ